MALASYVINIENQTKDKIRQFFANPNKQT